MAAAIARGRREGKKKAESFATVCHKVLLKLGETCSLGFFHQTPANPLFMRVYRVFDPKAKWQRARDSNPCTSLERAVS